MAIPPWVFADLFGKHHILLPCIVHLFISAQDHDPDLVLVEFPFFLNFLSQAIFSYLLITSGIQTLYRSWMFLSFADVISTGLCPAVAINKPIKRPAPEQTMMESLWCNVCCHCCLPEMLLPQLGISSGLSVFSWLSQPECCTTLPEPWKSR